MPSPHAAHDVGHVQVAVVVATSTRTPVDDTGGALVADRLTAAGHAVVATRFVDDDVAALRAAVQELCATGVGAVVITGGTGLSPRDVTPEAVEPLFTRTIPGFGELFRALSFAELGADALASRATAGVVGHTAVFAIPGSPGACRTAVDRLIGPALSHLVGQLHKPEGHLPVAPRAAPPPPTPPRSPRAGEITEEVELEVVPPAPGAEQPPVARALHRGTVEVKHRHEEAAAPSSDDGPWQRHLKELGATLLRGEREPLPEEVERFAPLVDLLGTAGDVAVLVTPAGRRYSVWGFPDLRKPASKVLVLGQGWPLCELVPLHRAGTGTCIDGPLGLVTLRSAPVADTAERLVGRAPPTPGGQLFAVAGDAVYVERDGKVTRWDGHKEAPLGTTRQALASLALEWSRR